MRCSWFLLALGLSVDAAAVQSRLFLAGGHLPVCSSTSAKACTEFPREWSQARGAPRYQIDTALSERIRDSGLPGLQSLLPELQKHSQHTFTSAADLLDVLPTLEPALQDALLDLAEIDERDAHGERKLERVALDSSRNTDAAALYRSFVAMAPAPPSRPPRILVLTASARDSFAAVDYYLAAFAAAGADPQWLPLDAPLRQLLDARAARNVTQNPVPVDCSELESYRQRVTGAFDRDRIYPDHAQAQQAVCADPGQLLSAIDAADGVFLNGGDQSLLLTALHHADGRPSAELKRLLERLRKGQLVLGGTSAGSAVQSARAPTGVMLSNGSSRQALVEGAFAGPPPACQRRTAACNPEQLTYAREGGLGSFEAGVVDTHFSARGRQWRLAVLLDQLELPLGLGVDETTALQVFQSSTGVRLNVQGSGAVHWLLPMPETGPGLDLVILRQQAGETLELAPGALAPLLRGAALACEPARGKTLQLNPDNEALDLLLRARQAVGSSRRLRVAGRNGSLCALSPGRWRLQLEP